jgi:hypothetical protein
MNATENCRNKLPDSAMRTVRYEPEGERKLVVDGCGEN